MTHTGLLVVGGGPVGLSAALLAARHGIPCVLLERHATQYRHPKARGVRARAMELFHLWGLEGDIRRSAPPDPRFGFIYCRSLTGEEYGRTPVGAEAGEHSPSSACRVPQDELERILRARVADTPGVTAYFGSTVDALRQDEQGVQATVTHIATGERETITAEYAIAADGAGSHIRAGLGIEITGDLLGYWQSAYWHGDISRLTRDRTAIQYLTATPDGGFVTIAPVDGRRRWITFRMRGQDGGDPGALTAPQARGLIRTAIGDARETMDIVSTATYAVAAKVARRYRVGRVFLAGDAAHVFPPTGGFGLNTGVQDVHNLVWKIAFVRAGHAGEGLLNSYESERRPVALSNAAWSKANAERFDAVWQGIAGGEPADAVIGGQRDHFAALERDLGFRYTQGALVREEPADASAEASSPLAAAVGRRAPHLRGTVDGREMSTLAAFEGRLTVLHGVHAHLWREAAEVAAKRFGVPVTTYRVPSPAFAVDAERFEDLYGMAPDGATLIRPDGHVAWRSPSGAAGHRHEILIEALRRTLSRERA